MFRVGLLACTACCCQLLAAAHAVGAVSLGVEPLVQNRELGPEATPGTLVRELARQALLVTARDELGLHTDDATLREEPAEGAGGTKLQLAVDVQTAGHCTLRLSHQVDGKSKEFDAIAFDFEPKPRDVYRTLATQLEAASRDKFSKLLLDCGLEPGEIKPAVSELSVDYDARIEEIDILLTRVDVVSQYMAVRQTHAAIARWGESPAALERLVRGYAGLGIMTEANWSPVTNVMKARSLIYAHRLAAMYPTFPTARWSLAYAYALAGIHAAALVEVEAIAKSQSDADADDADESVAKAPLWTELVAPYVNFDVERFDELAAEESLVGWANVLALWSTIGTGEDRLLEDQAMKRMTHCPEAYNIVYLLGQEGAVGVKHRVEYAALGSLAQAIPKRLNETRGVPESAIAALPEKPLRVADFSYWPKLIAALRQTDDGEFSTTVLATLLEDVAVSLASTVVYSHQTAYQEHALDEIVGVLMPVVNGTQAEAYFRMIVPLRAKDDAAVGEAARELRFKDPNRWMYRSLYFIWNVKNSAGEAVGHRAYDAAERDFTCPSLVIAARTTGNDDAAQKRQLMRELAEVSPGSPLALVFEIRVDHEDPAVVTAERLAEWEKRAGDHAGPWRELGALYAKREAYDDALRCYETSFVMLPDDGPIYAMATIYEKQKQLDKVVPTLERYLKVEDQGLGHSNIHAEIAQFHIRQKQFVEAKPHALEAAESYSGQGLQMAADVCELLNEREEAEKWYNTLSHAYPTWGGREWFFYRARIGLPPTDDARQLADQQFGDKAKRDLDASGWWPVAYAAFAGDRAEALRIARLRAEAKSDAYSECQVLTLALELGDEEQHQAARARLRRVTNAQDDANQKWNARFARAIEAILEAETADAVPNAEINALLTDQDSTMGWCDASYFFGKLALLKNFEEPGQRYLRYAAEFKDLSRITWNFASAEAAKFPAAEAPAGAAGEKAAESPSAPDDDSI